MFLGGKFKNRPLICVTVFQAALFSGLFFRKLDDFVSDMRAKVLSIL
jgi:hypothetical protein